MEGIIGMYAPPTENGTAAYIRSVSEMTGFSADQKLDLDDPSVLAKLIPAIIRHENGVQPYSPDLILKSVNDAMSDPRWGARELSMKSNIITPQSGSSVADVRDEISRGFSENKIRLDINVTNTATGQTTRRTVKGGAVSTAMDV